MSARTAVAMTIVVLAASATAVIVADPGSASSDGLSQVRHATARYHDVATAEADGFTVLRDAAGIACIDKPGAGGMGTHYVLGSRVEDPSEDVTKPELVIYAADKNGKQKLVAVEYVVLESAWKGAGHTTPPALLGHQFSLVQAGNRYGLPSFYELHAWAWEMNESGDFADYNPRVVCRT